MFLPFYFFIILFPTILSQEYISYDYLQHGADWPAFCKRGKAQSPIDLFLNKAQNSTSSFYFLPKYTPSFAFVSHLNTSLLLDLEGSSGSLFTISPDANGNSLSFKVEQIRFRAPSEHTFGGIRYPLEMQIYHKVIQNKKSRLNTFLFHFYFIFENY